MKDFNASMEEMLPLMLEILESGGEFRLFPRGTSMLPLLRQGVDSVVLTAPKELFKNDICLYRRKNGDLVLHRLVKIAKNGALSFRGDNQTVTEQGIKRAQILARVCRIFRGEKAKAPNGLGQRIYRLTHLSAPARAWRFRKRNKKRAD